MVMNIRSSSQPDQEKTAIPTEANNPDANALLILASGSPRRKDLLGQVGLPIDIRPANIAEDRNPGEEPVPYALRMAFEKAQVVAKVVGQTPARWVLGADTIVTIDGDVLGKPENIAHAVELLSRLVGRQHSVITAVALVASDTLSSHTFHVLSDVIMRKASPEEIRAYVDTGESLDKAGGYAAQGEGRRFIERIDGSETNVIGLPIDETLSLLRDVGYRT
jgi:septum formation protein